MISNILGGLYKKYTDTLNALKSERSELDSFRRDFEDGIDKKIEDLRKANDEQEKERDALMSKLGEYNALEDKVEKAKEENTKLAAEVKKQEETSWLENILGIVAEKAPWRAYMMGWVFRDNCLLKKAAERVSPKYPEFGYFAAKRIGDENGKQEYTDKVVEKRSGLWGWLFSRFTQNKNGEKKSLVKLASEYPMLAYRPLTRLQYA